MEEMDIDCGEFLLQENLVFDEESAAKTIGSVNDDNKSHKDSVDSMKASSTDSDGDSKEKMPQKKNQKYIMQKNRWEKYKKENKKADNKEKQKMKQMVKNETKDTELKTD